MLEIKGITVPAFLVKLDQKKSFEDNLAELESRLSSGMFKNSVIIIDDSQLQLSTKEKEKIDELLKKHNIQQINYINYQATQKSKNEKKSLKIIPKTLRSGQKVEYDGSVVVLGDVNPDAYVVASGSVIVMGALRGFAHAGATGDESAVVMALKFLPQQVRIASYITRSPDDVEEVNYPEMAYVEDGKIVIEKIK